MKQGKNVNINVLHHGSDMSGKTRDLGTTLNKIRVKVIANICFGRIRGSIVDFLNQIFSCNIKVF